MIKPSAILLIAVCLTRVMRRRAASERHAVLIAAILSAAILPVLSLILPAWRPPLAQRIAGALPQISAATSTDGSSNSAIVFRAIGIEPAAFKWAAVWTLIWIAGVVAALLLFSIGLLKQRNLATRSRALCDPALEKMAADVAATIGCRQRIRLLRSLDAAMPMTWGALQPRLLFPNSVNDWSDGRKRVVVAHEVAHIHRLDWLFQTLARLACAVYWFNPLLWIACSQLYRESEQACDDIVINLGVDARDYASHLFEIARGLRHSGSIWATTLAMARESTLERRFAVLLSPSVNRRAVSSKTFAFVTCAALFAVLPLAAMTISRGTPPKAADVLLKVDQYTTPPLYSDEARMRGIEGIVTVQVRVGRDGTVQQVQVVKSLGYGLDENASLAVRDWRFVPTMQHGVPVETTTQVNVEFSLRNAELNELIANDMATRIGPGVTPPQIVHRVEPQHSTTARQRPAGAVVLDVVILEDGTPKIIRVIRSLGWQFDEIAINALKQWIFSPAMKDGKAVKVRMNIAVDLQSRQT